MAKLTGRMILNYMLAINNIPLCNIRDTSNNEYLNGVTQAIVYKNYDTLLNVIKSNPIYHSRELYASIMQYNKTRDTRLKINGSQIKSLTIF